MVGHHKQDLKHPPNSSQLHSLATNQLLEDRTHAKVATVPILNIINHQLATSLLHPLQQHHWTVPAEIAMPPHNFLHKFLSVSDRAAAVRVLEEGANTTPAGDHLIVVRPMIIVYGAKKGR